nr:recombinase family protein [uncultured Brevundimonas sp.]
MSRNEQLNPLMEQTKACIYVHTAQTRSQDVKAQIEACRAVADASGLTVVKTEIDGGRGPRDGLARVLQDAESGLFDTLIVMTIGRISREAVELLPVLVRLRIDVTPVSHPAITRVLW